MSIGILQQAMIEKAKKKLATVQATQKPVLQKPNNIGINLDTNYLSTGIPKAQEAPRMSFAESPVGKILPGVEAISQSFQQKSPAPLLKHLSTKFPDPFKNTPEEREKTYNLAMGFTGGGYGNAGKKISKHLADKLKSEATDIPLSSAQQSATRGNIPKIASQASQKSQGAYQANVPNTSSNLSSKSEELVPSGSLKSGEIVPESSLQQKKLVSQSPANSTKPTSFTDNLAPIDPEIKSMEAQKWKVGDTVKIESNNPQNPVKYGIVKDVKDTRLSIYPTENPVFGGATYDYNKNTIKKVKLTPKQIKAIDEQGRRRHEASQDMVPTGKAYIPISQRTFTVDNSLSQEAQITQREQTILDRNGLSQASTKADFNNAIRTEQDRLTEKYGTVMPEQSGLGTGGYNDLPDLEAIRNKVVANQTNPISSLVTEARKYKSAEEFATAAKELFLKRREKAFNDPYLKINYTTNEESLLDKLDTYLQSKDVGKLYDSGKRDPEILTDLWNKANKYIDPEIKSLEKSAMSHLANKPEAELSKLKQSVDEARIALELKKEGLKNTPASQLTRFEAKRGEFKGGLPEVGAKGKGMFAKRGDDIADELGFADSETARNAYTSYTKQRSLMKQDEAVLSKARREYLESKKNLAITRQTQKEMVPKSSFTTAEPVGDPVQKITALLKKAESLQGTQDALYRAERAQRVARVAKMGEKVSGEQGYFAQLGQLKGGLPRVDFKSIRNQVSQKDIDTLFDTVEQARIFSPFEKVTAKGALAKILGKEGGTLPTRNEIELLSEVFPPEFIDAILKNRSAWQKIMAAGGNALNLPRAMMATADLSAPFRQGIFLIGKPKQFFSAFRHMFKYAFSQKAYDGLMDSIQARSTYKVMRQNRLSLTDMGKFMSRREEDFMSNFAERIPLFGRVAKGSNRAYSGFLNKLRADVFDDLYKKAQKLGIDKSRPKAIEDIAKFVNSATGRGDLGRLQKMAPVLNGLFFSPRLMASRFNLLNPHYYYKLDPFARKEALKSLLSFGGIALTVLGLAKMGGAEVEDDPRNANFGKIKIDNTRYDILGGFQQYIRLASQLISGKIISSTTGREITLGEGYKPLTRKDVLFRFFENKESPVASFVTALMTGQTGMGEDFNLPTEVINRFIPLVTQDMFDIYKERGLEDIGMALPGLFGVGSQTYGGQDLMKGKNALGKDTVEIKPKQGIGETISSKVFGEPVLSSSKSFDVESYYDQMLQLPKEEARKQFDEIARTNKRLAEKIVAVSKDRKLGITVHDKELKSKGVANGDRAMALAEEFNKLESKEEKKALWEEYVKKSVITKEVAVQLIELLKK
jgi:hypothetical protein